MKDDYRKIAFDPRVPFREHMEAYTQLSKEYLPSQSDLVSAEVVNHFSDWLMDQENLQKSAQIVPYTGVGDQRGANDKGMRSLYIDGMQVLTQGDYYEKPSMLSFNAMRAVVEQTPVLGAAILTRQRQVARFCRPSDDDRSPGFAIRHIDPRHEISKTDEASMRALAQFIKNCGWETNPRIRKSLRRDTFHQIMMKLVRDSLTMDSSPIETEFKKNKSLGIDGFYAVDGATIRLCGGNGYDGDPDIYAVQSVNGRVVTKYTTDDLIYEPRNPRTDVMIAGYGMSEVELMVRVVTGFLNAMTTNIAGFDNNSIPQGVLHISGNYSNEDLNAFKRYWNSVVKGVNNRWAMPMLISKDQESKASFERFGVEYNEMFFSRWMTFLTSIICALFGMDPAEINFESFSAGPSTLSGSDTTERLAASKDKGLRPLLAYYESLFTDYIISSFSDKYVLRFTGLDEESEDKKFEMKKLTRTVNEVRKEDSISPLEGPLGDAPLNPSLLQLYMQIIQNQEPPPDQQSPGEQRGLWSSGADNEVYSRIFLVIGEFMLKVGDEVLIGNPAHPHTGKLLTIGRDGCVTTIAGEKYQVKWKDIIGYKIHLEKSFNARPAPEDIWSPLENPWVSVAVEQSTVRGIRILNNILYEFLAFLPSQTPVEKSFFSWTKKQLNKIKEYLDHKKGNFSLMDWGTLVDWLVQRYLPNAVAWKEADYLASRAVLAGMLDAASQREAAMTEAEKRAAMAALENDTTRLVSFEKIHDKGLEFARAHAAENITYLTDVARHRMKSAIIEWEKHKDEGGTEGTVAALQQHLQDEFADLNRDFRRIAITEAARDENEAFILAMPMGAKVKRIENYSTACPFCRKINGMVFTVVPADKPEKDGWSEVWAGKTNIGRSSSISKRTPMGLVQRMPEELWWPSAGVQHPNCRGAWVQVSDEAPNLNPDFMEKARAAFAKAREKAGLK